MDNNIEYNDMTCAYCKRNKVKQMLNKDLNGFEPNWYFCSNCGYHIFKQDEQPRYA